MFKDLVRNLLLAAMLSGNTAFAAEMEKDFASPPAASRPWVIWYWQNEMQTKEGITADLEAMCKVGIGGVQIGFIGGHDEPRGDVTILSPKWRQIFAHAVSEAKRLGMVVSIWNSPGWSSSGGPWITPELAMQKLTWSETRVKGPIKNAGTLSRPRAAMLGNPWAVTKERATIWNDFYRDVAVLAFPTPTVELWDGAPPMISSDDPKFEAAKIQDNDPGTCASLANPSPGQPQYLRFDFGKPFQPRTLAVEFRSWGNAVKSVNVENSDDGLTWREVRRCGVRGGHSFPLHATLVSSPARYWRVGLASDKNGPSTLAVAELNLLSGARVEDWTGKAMYDNVGLDKPAFSSSSASSDAVIAKDRILVLSERLRPDGTLDWEVPPGDWTVVRYGRTLTLSLNCPATPSGSGLECDKLNAAALDFHWDHYLAPLFADEPFKSAVSLVHIDSYERGAQNWSPRLPVEFQNRRGYDVTRFLPAMTGRVIDSVEDSERFLWDLRQTICDTMADAYFGRMADLCHREGKQFSVEPYHQVQFDNMTCGGRGDLIQTEFWQGGWPGPYYFKLGVSPAHVYGRRVIGAEAFTAPPEAGGNWSTDPWALKPLGDLAYCQGVNHFIFHVSTQQPWLDIFPGLCTGPFGQHLERGNTWFDLSSGWLTYLARCQYMLQQGSYVGDVLYSVGENTPNESHTTGESLPPGYDFDNINPEAILTRLTVKDGRFQLPDGLSYAVLVLPESDDFMTAAMAEKLRTLVKAGGIIIGPRPSRSPSLKNQPVEDETVRAVAAELWGDMDGKRSTERRVGSGRVYCGVRVPAVLQSTGIRPDFSYAAKARLTLKHAHRRTSDADIYFLSDATWPYRDALDAPTQVEARFRVAGRQPELWDALTGERRPLPEFREENGETVVPLSFGPRQSWFVVFKETSQKSKVRIQNTAKNFSELKPVMEVRGAWEVQFDPKWGGPEKTVTFAALEDWTKQADPGIRYYSGKAIYRTNFECNAQDAKSRIYLELGKVKNIAAVRLNGRELGTVWCAPWRVEITSALRSGNNALEITVANLWPNRLIGDEQLPDDCQWTMTGFGIPQLKAWPDWLLTRTPRTSGRYAFTTWKHWKKDDALLPSGLLGPVRMMID
jgi:hypothetical protein